MEHWRTAAERDGLSGTVKTPCLALQPILVSRRKNRCPRFRLFRQRESHVERSLCSVLVAAFRSELTEEALNARDVLDLDWLEAKAALEVEEGEFVFSSTGRHSLDYGGRVVERKADVLDLSRRASKQQARVRSWRKTTLTDVDRRCSACVALPALRNSHCSKLVDRFVEVAQAIFERGRRDGSNGFFCFDLG
jgi:hypothetical protein